MCSFGQLVAHILTPVAYRSSRRLSEPLWNAVYFYSLAFVLMIVFNGVQLNLRQKYSKLVVVEEDPHHSKRSVTLRSSAEGSGPKDLKRVDDDEESEESARERVQLKRAHHDVSLKRWSSCSDLALLPKNVWLFSLLTLLMAISCDSFMYNTAALYQQKFNMGI